jgi:hypothetical protein
VAERRPEPSPSLDESILRDITLAKLPGVASGAKCEIYGAITPPDARRKRVIMISREMPKLRGMWTGYMQCKQARWSAYRPACRLGGWASTPRALRFLTFANMGFRAAAGPIFAARVTAGAPRRARRLNQTGMRRCSTPSS